MSYKIHLAKDKKMRAVMDNHDSFELSRFSPLHLSLCKSVVSQQLSTKVAAVIYQRFLALFSSTKPSAKAIAAMPLERLREIGLSNSKAAYIHNICAFWAEHKLTDKKLSQMPDDEIIELLIRIKGVGRWTVEMLLMFALGREDVFAVDDLSIQQSMCRVYNIDPTDKKAMKQQMQDIAAKWSPWRTYACRHLWKWHGEVKKPQ